MRRLCAIAFAAWLPGQAISDTCAQDWGDITQTDSFGLSKAAALEAGEDGWCQVAIAEQLGTWGRIEALAFRIAEAGELRAIEMTLNGLQTPLGSFEGTAALSLETATGVLLLQDLQLSGEDDRGLRITATAGVPIFDLSAQTPARAVRIDFYITQAALADTGIAFSQLSRAAVDSALRDVSDRQISGKTRREFLRFVGAMPNARGTLSVTIDLLNDARIADVVTPYLTLGRSPSDDEIARVFDIAFDDIRLDLAWKPGRM